MRWPWQPKFDSLIRDTAVLDQQLANPTTRASVDMFVTQLEAEGLEVSPENLTDLAVANGIDRDGAQLLCALAARLQGAS
ncbi:hypothetical protein [Bosea massiliensis]|uniref:Uncharacterized protein n=1 Tax=Bosea massiliensis TaxID=151419 RepID=A0ABW0NYI7_9HYPH